MRERNGFSLVELLAALAVGMVMLLAIYGVVNVSQRSTSGIERKVIAQQDARAALELMAMEIRMASYNPSLNNGIWKDPGDCASAAACPLCKGIQEATANAIAVEMDIGGGAGSGSIGDGPNEIIRYRYDAANQYITRETNCGGGQPFLGDKATSTNPRTVRVINDINGNGAFDAGTDIPLLRYFDGAGTEIFPTAGDQTPIPHIRRIDIALAVETEDVDPNTHRRRRLIYATSVIPRNHAPNL